MATTLLIVRHGHVEGIDPPRFRGRAELELTELGRAQAAALAARIHRDWTPDAVLTSPRGRAVATGAAIAAQAGLAPRVADELDDIDYGDWSLKTHAEAERQDPERFRAWFEAPQTVRFPGGEALSDLDARAERLLARLRAGYEGRTVVLAAHDSINRVLLLRLLDRPLSDYWLFAQGPCNVSEAMVGADRVRIGRINDTGHLPQTPK